MLTIGFKLVAAIALPVVVFLGGIWIMSRLCDHQHVQHVLKRAEPADRKPLHQRLRYNADDVERHWRWIANDDRALASEQRFLEMDLVFPFLYGAALATSLLIFWALLGRSFSPVWIFAPVVITVLADWTENLVLLAQLRRYIETGKEGLNPAWICVASTATAAKLVFFTFSCLLILVLAIAVVSRCASSFRREPEASASDAQT